MTLREFGEWASKCDEDILDYELAVYAKKKLYSGVILDLYIEITSIDENVDVDNKQIILHGE